jgi:hypothetical protein
MAVIYHNNIIQIKKAISSGEVLATLAPVVTELTELIKAATPVLTGDMRDSIVNKPHSKYGWSIYTPLKKVIHIEYGTSDTPVFGMFRKSFDGNAVRMAKQLEADFKKLIEKTV